LVEIITLGDFTVKVNGETISNDTNRANMLWKLLGLLIAGGNKPLSINFLTDAIWPDKEADVATKSLHNLIFRLRRLFGNAGCDVDKLVVFFHKSYTLDVGHGMYIDAREVEKCFLAAKDPNISETDKIANLNRVVELYNGEYLVNIYDDPWAVTAVGHYKRMFFEAVGMLADIYLKNQTFDRLFQICDKSIALEPLEEAAYIRMIEGMKQNGMTVRAIELCEVYFNLLYTKVGVSPSARMNSLYRDLKGSIRQLQQDASSIMFELMEREQPQSFFCSMEVFTEIYRYEARQFERRGESLYIALLTINNMQRDIPTPSVLARAMENLYVSCLNAIRRGDIFTRYSNSQYLLLLTRLTGDDQPVVESRIKEDFYSRRGSEDIIINFEMLSAPVNSQKNHNSQ